MCPVSTSIASEVARRRRPVGRAALTPFGDLASVCRNVIVAAAAASSIHAWPSARYQADPVAFAHEVLGDKPWEKQIEIIEAVRDNPRVAVSSGHKVGKSRTAGVLALWFYCSFPDARVVMSSTTSRQVDQILWREVRMLHTRSTVPIGGDLHELARSGLKADDFREIVGFTAREAEAVAGISGANLLYILDEASGIPQAIFEAIEGNRAGGARIVMFSNPTRTEGEFFEAFNAKAAFYKTLRVSSEDSPNVVANVDVIPGLATRRWIDEKREEWGEDSPLFKIRVKGEFVLAEDGKIFSVHAIGEAEARWADAPEVGRLCVGLDPAGPGLAGDESAYAWRRGLKVIGLATMRGLSEDAHLAHLLGIIQEQRRPHEGPPLVLIDREGPIGSAVYGRLRSHSADNPDAFEVVGIRSSDRARRQPQVYDRMRDELWARGAEWLREGGALPEDAKLSKDLHSPEWIGQLTGRLKVTGKDELRKKLGRSPDRGDAVLLSVWEPLASRDEDVREAAAARVERREEPEDLSVTHDPYAGADLWQKGC